MFLLSNYLKNQDIIKNGFLSKNKQERSSHHYKMTKACNMLIIKAIHDFVYQGTNLA